MDVLDRTPTDLRHDRVVDEITPAQPDLPTTCDESNVGPPLSNTIGLERTHQRAVTIVVGL